MTFLKSLYRKKRKNETFIRYISYLLHLWMGLLSCIVVMVICITGCLYAFKNQIIDFANYDHARVRAVGLNPQTLSQVQLELGKRNQILTSLIIHDNPARSWIVSYKEQNVDKTAYYDPYIGQVKGYPDTGSSRFFEIVLDLHRNLMMGNVGRQIVGVSALVFCFLLISGLVLWLPKKLKHLKQALTIKTSAKWARLNYDLHNTLGFYTCLVLFFIAVTGLYITYPWMKNALIVSLGGSSIAEATAIGSAAGDDAFDNLMSDMIERQKEKKQKAAEVVSLDDIRNKADQKLNYKAVTSITLPNDENPRYTIIKTNTENFFGMMLPDELTFDKEGKLKTINLFSDLPLDKQFTTLAKPLHTGEIMGLKSVVLYFIVCLIGFSLPITGFVIYWHRYKKNAKV